MKVEEDGLRPYGWELSFGVLVLLVVAAKEKSVFLGAVEMLVVGLDILLEWKLCASVAV